MLGACRPWALGREFELRSGCCLAEGGAARLLEAKATGQRENDQGNVVPVPL